MKSFSKFFALLAAGSLTLVAACSADTPPAATPDHTGTTDQTAVADQGTTPAPSVVRVVSHDSLNLDEAHVAAFEAETGYQLEFSAPGDAGTLVNQLILTKNAPLGDVTYGVDNVSAGRGIAEGVFAEYTSPNLPPSAEEFIRPGLTPIDRGDVCLNVDLDYFADAQIPAPTSFTDLLDEQYAGMFVTTNAATSSPGVAILLATIAEFGPEGYLEYWQNLTDNGLRVASGWSEAYYTDFTAGDTGGTYPIVTSYASSPAYDPSTAALLDTCYTQIEYAGVLEGAQNPEGAQAFIDFLLSPQVQESIPEQMYMYPIDESVELPQEWAQNAPLPEHSRELDTELVDENLRDWITQWSDVVAG